MRKIWYFIKLTRPLFLVGGVLLYSLGALMALSQGARLNIFNWVTGQVLVTAIQLMTQYSNEYYDLEGDRLNASRTWFSGGSGVLSSGLISPRVALTIALALAGVSLLVLVVASLQVPLVAFFGLAGLLAAWSYSGPPLALARAGWGELSASLVVAFFVPLVGYSMQSGGRITPSLLVVCLPLVLIHFAMLIAFQIPDRPSDEATGKRTLCVRLGEERAIRLHNLSILLAFGIILALTILRWPGTQFAWLTLPLAVWQSITIRRYITPSASTPAFGWLTFRALSLFAVTATLWLVGIAWMMLV
jgi:1,4-dihydroxy-2-naphthoate octaprenyltransferase